MKIYDISIPLSNDIIIWPGDPSIKISRKCSISNGDPCNVSNIEMGVHTATHIDAPNHFLDNGYTTDKIDLNTLIGDCLVIESNEKLITSDSLKNTNLNNYDKVLFKTKNSSFWDTKEFNKDFVGVSLSAAKYLIEQNIKLIGIDYLSIEAFNSDGSVHKELLSNEIVILEGLNLTNIPCGEYELICLPLKILNSDGAPARAILIGK